MRETAVLQRIRLGAAYAGSTLWRNNSGALQDKDGRLIRFGLGHDSGALNKVWKSSDLIGILPVTIQPEHVGRLAGIFMAVETKEPTWNGTLDAHTAAQNAFLETVRKLGGVGMFARSTDEYFTGAKWP
jgi:hypothetical protein